MSAIGLKIPLPRSRHVLPGFSLSLGFTLFYLTGIVLIPLLALIIRPFELGWDGFWTAISTPRVLAVPAPVLRHGALAAVIDSVFGFIIAWVLVRYRFPGTRRAGCGDRPAFRAAHGGGGHRAVHPLCAEWLDRFAADRLTASRSPTRPGACWWR